MPRPTRHKQVDMEKTLREHFEKHHSALYTSELTGHARDTVSKYFNAFAEKMVEEINTNFINRQKIRKEQVIAQLEHDLAVLDDHLKEVTNQSLGDASNASLHSVRLGIVKARSEIKQQIADIDMTPTLDITISEIMESRLAEHSGQKT